ncbi:hypothetical protein [Lysobacter gummosus]|uniref:hypothetical protein n=1 Tax=Lysobacter gummosus TaxID=262324 RepID=UPI003643B248
MPRSVRLRVVDARSPGATHAGLIFFAKEDRSPDLPRKRTPSVKHRGRFRFSARKGHHNP